MNDFYARQTYDYTIRQGDTLNIPLSFYDKSKSPLSIVTYDARFALLDPQTGSAVAALVKTHDDAVAGGDGIYYLGDAEAWSELNLTVSNQLQIVLKAEDTADLLPQVYRWQLEFEKTINGVLCRKMAANGWLTVVQDVVPNV